MRKGSRSGPLKTTLFLIIALIWFFPIFWMIGKAFTPNRDILRNASALFPKHATFENLASILTEWPFLRWIGNSVIVTSGALVVTIVIAILAAYSFSRIRWKGRNVVFLLFLSSMFVPWEINAIPLYFVVNFFGLLNTHPGVFLPITAMPIGMFLLRQFFVNIPRDLEDAARIDGARRLGVLFRVFLPMSVSAIGALVIWVFLFAWNEFFWSLISLQRSARLTLPIGLKTIMGAQNIEYGSLFGASFLAMIPSLVLFMFLRKRIISGISLSGSIK
jgi:multiple sugar transport system permease protein